MASRWRFVWLWLAGWGCGLSMASTDKILFSDKKGPYIYALGRFRLHSLCLLLSLSLDARRSLLLACFSARLLPARLAEFVSTAFVFRALSPYSLEHTVLAGRLLRRSLNHYEEPLFEGHMDGVLCFVAGRGACFSMVILCISSAAQL